MESDVALPPDTNIAGTIDLFEQTGRKELAVLKRAVLGVISETYVRLPYAEELDRGQRELFAER